MNEAFFLIANNSSLSYPLLLVTGQVRLEDVENCQEIEVGEERKNKELELRKKRTQIALLSLEWFLWIAFRDRMGTINFLKLVYFLNNGSLKIMISQDISKVTGQMRVLSGKHKSFKTNALQMIYTPNTPKLPYVFKGNLFRTQGNLKLFPSQWKRELRF